MKKTYPSGPAQRVSVKVVTGSGFGPIVAYTVPSHTSGTEASGVISS